MTSFTDEADDIRMMRESIRRFIAKELPPEKVREWDRDRHFPREVFQRLASLGVCGLTIDEKYGGLGRNIVAAIAVLEELSRVSTTLAGPYIHCAFYGGINISEKGSPEQKADLLPRLAAGELLFAYGLSEPNVGGDLATVTTRADLSADKASVVVNGAKRWCTMADIADYIYCLVRSDRQAPRYKNLSLVLIPKGADGVHYEPIDHMGIGYAETFDVTFENVEIPASLIIGGPEGWNNGWPMLVGPALDVEKLEIAAMTYGLTHAALSATCQYAQEREQFGKPIIRHQAVSHALADALTNLQACKHMLYHAAWLADRRDPCSAETSMAKLFVTEACEKIVLDCQKVFGAYGFAEEYAIARHVRDILLMPVIGGSSNMQRNNIAKRLSLI